jgi:hypothetical protein
MPLNPDFEDLFAALNDADARYLLVGGYALAFHGHPRFTKDLDVWVEPTATNAGRVHAALADFGAPLHDLTPGDLTREGLVFQIGLPPNRIDVLTSIDGVAFAQAWEQRETTRYGRSSVPVLGRRQLIVNKRATGRPQDLIDAVELEKDA